jgi:hypothetical protein
LAIVRSATPEGPSAVEGQGHIITVADELFAAWTRRDQLYTQRETELAGEEVAAIIEQREMEAGYVEPRRRQEVFMAAHYWRPPLPVKGGWE